MFLKPEKLRKSYIVTKEKQKRKKERGEGKEKKKEKGMVCTLSLYNSYFGDNFWPKKTVQRKRSICR